MIEEQSIAGERDEDRVEQEPTNEPTDDATAETEDNGESWLYFEGHIHDFYL